MRREHPDLVTHKAQLFNNNSKTWFSKTTLLFSSN